MKKVLKEEVLELRNKGLSYKEIRGILGCSKSLISYHCRNAGKARVSNKFLKEEIDLANKLYEEGKNLLEISKTLKRTRHATKNYILNYNVKKYRKNLSKSQSVVNWRKRKKIQLVEYKGGSCKICGYSKCLEALAFHHLDPKVKDFTIGGKSWGFERLKEEVDKCVLLCSRCHIEVHQGLHINLGL